MLAPALPLPPTPCLHLPSPVPCYHKGQLKYQLVDIYDDERANISQHFEQSNQFIEGGRAAGGVLVHCYAGVSRSATLVLAYLMSRERLPLKLAMQRVREARPAAQPNAGFFRQLEKYRQGGLKATLRNLQAGDRSRMPPNRSVELGLVPLAEGAGHQQASPVVPMAKTAALGTSPEVRQVGALEASTEPPGDGP